MPPFDIRQTNGARFSTSDNRGREGGRGRLGVPCVSVRVGGGSGRGREGYLGVFVLFLFCFFSLPWRRKRVVMCVQFQLWLDCPIPPPPPPPPAPELRASHSSSFTSYLSSSPPTTDTRALFIDLSKFHIES